MIMTRLDFLNSIFIFFKVKEENTELKNIYQDALTTKKTIDWFKMYKSVITTAESRYLPPAKWFIEKMKNFEIVPVGSLDGHKVKVIYKNGKFTEYVMITEFGINLNKLVERCKFGDNKDKDGNEIARIELYDQNVLICQKETYPKNAPYKLLYECEKEG